ncbi:oligosaccharide flippase family protein [Halomarina pelagica]|uniref:oligosaccharide flippase family protein n=1 Tax=Halomarina pelagica TaxID=2961599 RepID=UPI0020C1D47D|nr:oligosaccharide flippase family protein [Halomarina sp. BND7]
MNKSLTEQFSVAFLGGIFGRALRYSFSLIIAQGLGLDALGLFAFGLVLLKVGSVIARVGFDTAAQKFVPIYQNHGDNPRVTGIILVSIFTPLLVGVILNLLFYVTYEQVQAVIGSNFTATIPLFIAGIPLFSVMMVCMAATRGFKDTKYAVIIRDIGQTGSGFVFIVIGASVVSDFTITIIGYLASLFVGIGLGIFSLYRLGGFNRVRQPIFEIRENFRFSLPVAIVAVTQYLISWTDVLVLGLYSSPTQLGWYQAAFQTTVLLAVVLESVNAIFPSVVAEYSHTGQIKRLKRVYVAATKWITYLTVLGCLFLIIYRTEVLSIFGEPIQVAQSALVILSVSQSMAAVVGPAGYLLSMTGHERVELLNTVSACLINIALNLALVPASGIVGAAIATGISLTLLNILRAVEVWYFFRIIPYSVNYWKGFMAISGSTALMTVINVLELPLSTLELLPLVSIGSLLLFFILYRFLGMDTSDAILFKSIL